MSAFGLPTHTPIPHGLPSDVMRFFLDHAIGASVSVMTRDLELVYVNTKYADSFRVTPEKIIGTKLSDWYSPAHVASFMPHVERAFAGERVRYDRSSQVVGSEGVWFTVTLTPWFDEAGNVVGIFHCAMTVDELKRSAEALRVANERVSSHMENSPLTVLELDESLNVSHCSVRALSMFGSAPSELAGKPLMDALRIDDPEGLFADSFRRLQEGVETRNRVESAIRHADGRVIHCDWFNSAITDRNGKVISIMSLVEDISSRVEAAAQLLHFATHDSLTGLGNRRVLTERLTHCLSRAERTGEAVALLFIDLDGFKHVNDVYGHSAGDEVLREVAKRLQRVARQTDFIARMGGDEFVILLEGSVEIDTPSRVAERVLETLCPPIAFPGGTAVVGASIGIAVHPPLPNLAVDLIRRADAAMYSAKKAGKGCVRFASASE